MDVLSQIIAAVAKVLIGEIENFTRLPAAEQIAAVVKALWWGGGAAFAFLAALVGTFLWVRRRARAASVEALTKQTALENENKRRQEAIDKLVAEKEAILARCPVATAATMARALKDNNHLPATMVARAFLEKSGEGLAAIHRHLMEEALGRVEDGYVALDEAKRHAQGWMAADPHSQLAREAYDGIVARLERDPEAIEDAAGQERLYAALRDHAHNVDALMAVGFAENRRGDYLVARLVFERALLAAQRQGGNPDKALEARIWAMFNAKECGDFARAEAHGVVLARQIDGRPSLPADIIADFATTVASFLFEQGDYAGAEHRLRTSLAALEGRHAELTDGRLWTIKHEVAGHLLRRREFGEAETLLAELQNTIPARMRDYHLINFKHDFAELMRRTNRISEAETYAREAFELAVQRFGEQHPSTFAARFFLGRRLYDLRHFTECEKQVTEALNGFTQTSGVDHPHVGRCHHRLAKCLDQLGRREEADRHFAAAAAIFEAKFPPGHPEIVELEKDRRERSEKAETPEPAPAPA